MKNHICYFAVLCLLAFVTGGCKKEISEVTLEFNEAEYELCAGETLDLSKELRVTGSDHKPRFSSSDKDVVSVDSEGVATGCSAGSARITASVSGKTASCIVSVPEVSAGSIVLTAQKTLVADGQTWGTVSAEVGTAGFDMADLVWTFTPSDELLDVSYERINDRSYRFRFGAYIEDGTLTVQVSDRNSSASASVMIEAVEPESEKVEARRISIDAPKSLTEGEDICGTVTVTVAPEEYDPANLVWTFTPVGDGLGFNSEKVSDLVYRIWFTSYVEGGKVQITVTDSVSELFGEAVVSVRKRPESGVTALSVSPESLRLYTDSEPVALDVDCMPSDYDKALLAWSSSDEGVLTVADGVITVTGAGSAVVTVRDIISGLEAGCEVTVGVPSEGVSPKSIVLSEVNLNMKVGGGSVQLVATCYDDNGEKIENYSDLEWTAEQMDGAVGKVDVVEVTQQGVVIPKAAGSTVITVSDRNNPAVKAVCNVFVADGVKPTGITLAPERLLLPAGMEYDGLSYSLTPADCDYDEVIWSSSDPAVATVSQTGKIRTLKAGVTVISVTTKEGGYSAGCTLTVNDMDFIVSLELDAAAADGLAPGESAAVIVNCTTVDGGTYTPSVTEWKSSAPGIVSVDENGIIAVPSSVQVGDEPIEVTITLTVDDVQTSVTVKVVRAVPKSLEITTYPEGYRMYVGSVFTFGAAVNPSYADQTVKWQCYCEAAEDSWRHIDLSTGYFTANAVGRYSITAFSAYEFRDAYGNLTTFTDVRSTIEIDVLPVSAESASLNQETLDMRVGNTASLMVSFSPSNTTYTELDWSSSDETVAVVSSTGIVTAIAGGQAVITARQEENDITLTCNVNVSDGAAEYAIGDYVYSDGEVSSELVPGKNVIGVVCLLNDITGHDSVLKSEHPGCTNGLVISIADSEAVKWQGYGASVSRWAVDEGFETLGGALVSWGMYDAEHYLTEEGEKMRGYNNTAAIRAYMQRDDYESLGEDYAVHLLDGWSESAPEGTSGWYVPSVAELMAVAENAQLLSERIAAAGGAPFDSEGYWTSTENEKSGSNAVLMKILANRFEANILKSKAHKVRYVFAF